MKILVLTNLYPPYVIGGYEIGCRDVVDELQRRGHEIRVVTSRFGVTGSSAPEENIFRGMYVRMGRYHIWDNVACLRREVLNRRIWIRHLKEFQPDIIYYWNLAGLSLWTFHESSRLGIPSACYVSDQWVENIPNGDYMARRWLCKTTSKIGKIYQVLLKKCAYFLELGTECGVGRLPHLQCTSAFIENGVSARFPEVRNDSVVIHWGIAEEYTSQVPVTRSSVAGRECILLYAGQIVAHKGLLTVIRAISLLKETHSNFRLEIAGGGQDHFQTLLDKEIENLGLQEKVVFNGRVSRSVLMEIYRSSDILLFASEWEEPFAISPLEGMACGCALIATVTGGSGEIFRSRENALTFKAGDPDSLAAAIKILMDDHILRTTIAEAGQAEVIAKHQMKGMVDQIEKHLKGLCPENRV